MYRFEEEEPLDPPGQPTFETEPAANEPTYTFDRYGHEPRYTFDRWEEDDFAIMGSDNRGRTDQTLPEPGGEYDDDDLEDLIAESRWRDPEQRTEVVEQAPPARPETRPQPADTQIVGQASSASRPSSIPTTKVAIPTEDRAKSAEEVVDSVVPEKAEQSSRFEVPERVQLYLPSERVRQVDQLTRETTKLVNGLDPRRFDPEVQPLLEELKPALGNLVVATITDGVAKISPAQQKNGGIAVVQLLPGEKSVVLDPSLTTSLTEDRLQRTMDMYGLPRRPIEEFLAQEERSLHRNPGRLVRAQLEEQMVGLSVAPYHFMRHPTSQRPVHLQSRPTIILTPDIEPPEFLHELAHGRDQEHGWRRGDASPLKELEWRAWKEMRANHIGATSAIGTVYSENPITKDQAHFESVRLSTTQGARGPFDPTLARIRALIAAGAMDPVL